MWRGLCASLGALLCLVATLPACAQNIGVATGTARAVIVAPMTLFKTYDMDFGEIVTNGTAGTMTINPVTNACQPSATLLNVGSCRSAQFAGMGGRNMTARITMSGITNLTGPGAPMTVNAFIVGANPTIQFIGNTNSNGNGNGLVNGGGNQRYRITSSSGIFTLSIGATLNVNANQAPGIYNGTFTVDVQYN